jgi:hypothetical protein
MRVPPFAFLTQQRARARWFGRRARSDWSEGERPAAAIAAASTQLQQQALAVDFSCGFGGGALAAVAAL